MVNQQLIYYIRSTIAKGYSQNQIYSYLVQLGYNPNEVSQAISIANSPTPRQTQVSSFNQQIQTPPSQGGVNFLPIAIVGILFVVVLGGGLFFFNPFGDKTSFEMSHGEMLSPERNDIAQKPQITCVEKWKCGGWSECDNGHQGRTCNDLNSCETQTDKPVESQSCRVECIEDWSCTDWSECIYTTGLPKNSRSCTDTNNCGTTLNKPKETQNCCYISCEDWSGICSGGIEYRGCDIVGCTQEEQEDVVSERSCEGAMEGTCTETDSGNDPFTKGITNDAYGMDYGDNCVGLNLGEWYCKADNTKGYESYTCEYDCQDGACVTPPTECSSGDGYCPDGCNYQQDTDCSCQVHSDCLTGNANAAALCEISFGEGTCIESTISDPIQITGDLDGFCNSYVNDCQESNLIDLEDGSNGITDIQLQVYEKPDDHGHPEYYPGCNIKILWGNGNNHLVDFWVDIGDNVETCKHNIPIYYYHTTAEMCGSAPCYGQFP